MGNERSFGSQADRSSAYLVIDPPGLSKTNRGDWSPHHSADALFLRLSHLEVCRYTEEQLAIGLLPAVAESRLPKADNYWARSREPTDASSPIMTSQTYHGGLP